MFLHASLQAASAGAVPVAPPRKIWRPSRAGAPPSGWAWRSSGCPFAARSTPET